MSTRCSCAAAALFLSCRQERAQVMTSTNRRMHTMASITDVELSVVPDVANAEVEIDTRISFDEFDIDSNQLYDLHWSLIGPDRLAGEDGVDDTLISQGAPEQIRFRAEGQASMVHHLAFTIALEELNEDLTGQDEVRAVMGLNPVGPFGDSAESNRVSLTVS
jgi:hypothetical protein